MPRLPIVDGDDDAWGTILNDYLGVSINPDGSLNSLAVEDAVGTLGGDLSGTLPMPTVAKVNGVAVSGTPTTGQVITATSPTAADWQTPGGGGGSGTVTSASVATANGFAGTTANPTTTPAFTLETTVTGLIKGNGTAIAAATAGTDYLAPTGNGSALTGITAAQVGAVAGPLTGDVVTSGAAATLESTANTRGVSRTTAWQDVVERPGAAGSPTVPNGLTPHPTASRIGISDVVIGDSVARGDGGIIGVTDWATQIALFENRAAGLVDPGPGYVPVNDPGDTYGWSSLSHGSQAANGANGGPSAFATSWELTTTGDVIGDNRTFRRVQILYQKVTNGDSVTFATTGTVRSSGSLDTNGSGYFIWDSGDLLAVTGTGVTATWGAHASGSGGGGVFIIGARYFQTGGENGIIMDNLGYGGSTSNNWSGSTGWTTYLSMLAATGSPARRLYVMVGINDQVFGFAPSNYATNLTAIVTAAHTASPLTEVVLVAQHYGDTLDTIAACTVSGGSPNTVTSANITVGLADVPPVGSSLVGPMFLTPSLVTAVTAGSCTVATPGTAGTADLIEINSRGGAANWAANWVPVVEAVANATGATFVSMYDVMGDVSPQAQVGSVTTTTGSTSATATSFPGVIIGQAVAGTGITAGTTVANVSGGTLTLSQPCAVGGTRTLTFSHDQWGLCDQTVPDIHPGDIFHSASGRDGQGVMAEAILRKTARFTGLPPTGIVENIALSNDGKVINGIAQGASGSVVSALYTVSTDVQPVAAMIYTPGVFNPGLYLGPGGSTIPDTVINRGGAGIVSVQNALVPLGLTGAVQGLRIAGSTASGHPTTGTFVTGDMVWDAAGGVWICTAGGSPGTWAGVGSGLAAPVIFTASGTWTPGTGGQQQFACTIVGGAGGGGPGSSTNGGGGGGGGEVLPYFPLGHVTTPQTVTVGAASSTGANGHASSIGGLVTAAAGFGGLSGSFTGPGGNGGDNSGGGPGSNGAAGTGATAGGGGSGQVTTNTGGAAGPGIMRLGSGGGGGGGPTSAAGGKGGGSAGGAGGTGAALGGGGGGAGGGGAGTNGSSGVGGGGANGGANTGGGGGGGGAGTTPGSTSTGGSGYVIIFQVA